MIIIIISITSVKQCCIIQTIAILERYLKKKEKKNDLTSTSSAFRLREASTRISWNTRYTGCIRTRHNRWCRREDESRWTSSYLHRREKKSPWLDLYVICISLARAIATHTWITLEIDTIFLPAVHPSLLPSVYHVSWMKIRSIRTLSRGGEECSSTPFRRGSNGRGGGCSTLILLLACNSRPCGFMFDCLGAKVHARF